MKKIISSCEVVEDQGVRTMIRRHLVCKAIEVENRARKRPSSQIYIRKIRNSALQKKGFFCRMKVSLYTRTNGKLFLVFLGHSLKIELSPIISQVSLDKGGKISYTS
ncbi:MAG: hypothetical protein ABIC18_04720 [Candidatus Omnitrophota bacterium]